MKLFVASVFLVLFACAVAVIHGLLRQAKHEAAKQDAFAKLLRHKHDQ